MDRRPSVLDTEDVQQFSLDHMPYPALKLILQYVYASEGPSALRCRLVSRNFNDLMLLNTRLHLDYRRTSEMNRCRLSPLNWPRKTYRNEFSTDELINSSLISRIFSMKIDDWPGRGRDWDPQDLIRLATQLSRTVDVSLRAVFLLPLLPVADIPQMRVVQVSLIISRDLTPAELNILANLQHLTRLYTYQKHLAQLNQHVDLLRLSELHIDMIRPRIPTWDVNFNDNFTHLHTLEISIGQISSDHNNSFNFRGVRMLQLVKCQLNASVPSDMTVSTQAHYTLLSSMRSAMPKLKVFCYSLHTFYTSPEKVGELFPAIFQFCPETVDDFHLNICSQCNIDHWQKCWNAENRSRPEWHRYFNTLFTAVLDSHITRVSFESCLKTVGYGLNATPFHFEANLSGCQVGMPTESTTKTSENFWFQRNGTGVVHNYQLKRKNGQICTLDVISKTSHRT